MIRKKLRTHLVLYFLMMTSICFVLWYIISVRKNYPLDKFRKYFTTSISSSELLCHPPNSSSFGRDRLKELILTNLDNRSVYVNETDASNVIYLSNNYSTLAEFIQKCSAALMSRRLVPELHSIQSIFHNPPLKDMVRPSCDGLWMEFGVFHGTSITTIANWKKAFCGNTSQSVYGFDTFTGLPSAWRPGFGLGSFDTNGAILSVPSNVVLVKGLFIDTLPTQLRLIDREYQCKTPMSFVHIDCDIYDGARDVLFLLGSRLVTGSILLFDELFNYPGYEKHEIKALFEFLAGSNLRLIPLGSSSNIDSNTTSDKYPQSFAFIVDLEETM